MDLYAVFNSRRENQYQSMQFIYTNINASPLEDDDDEIPSEILEFEEEQLSVATQLTSLTQTDGTLTQVYLSEHNRLKWRDKK